MARSTLFSVGGDTRVSLIVGMDGIAYFAGCFLSPVGCAVAFGIVAVVVK